MQFYSSMTYASTNHRYEAKGHSITFCLGAKNNGGDRSVFKIFWPEFTNLAFFREIFVLPVYLRLIIFNTPLGYYKLHGIVSNFFGRLTKGCLLTISKGFQYNHLQCGQRRGLKYAFS